MKNTKKICLLLMTVFILGEAMASEAHGRERIIDPKVCAEKMTGRMAKKYVFNDIQKQQL